MLGGVDSAERESSQKTEWFWAFHALQEFHIPLEKFAGMDGYTRMGYMAALSATWQLRREADENNKRR